MIDIKKLRYIVETARFESVTRAAGALHITQSALTRNIAEVEEDLGFQLFVRLSRGVHTTDAGASFVNNARQVVGDFETLLARADDYGALKTGRLRLGIAPAGFHRFVNMPIVEVARDNPGLTVEVITGSVRQLATRLSLGELDAMVGPMARLIQWPDLKVEALAQFHVAGIVRKNHPLLKKKKISEIDILKYPVVFPSTVETMETDMAALYAKNGLPPLKGRYISDDFDLTCELVKNTDAYAMFISLSSGFGDLGKRFHLLQNKIDMPPQKLALAICQSRSVTPAVNVFRNVAQKLFRKRPK